MRALWTAALGMSAQQQRVDIISNNIANVNTTAYKKVNTTFKDLIYENLKTAPSYRQNATLPRVGHGVAVGATTGDFKQGILTNTQRDLDVAIDGEGFFVISDAEGNLVFTRDGSFQISPQQNQNFLVTSDGNYVLDRTGTPINITDPSSIHITEDGSVYSNQNEYHGTIAIVDFTNKAGLEKIGQNLYAQTDASGNMMLTEQAVVKQGYLEASNVSIAQEMVDMIISQRAYQLNSRVVQTADDMIGMANDLRR